MNTSSFIFDPVSRMMKLAGTAFGLITLTLGSTMQLRSEERRVDTPKGDQQVSIKCLIIEAPVGTLRSIIHEAAPGVSLITPEEKTVSILKRLATIKDSSIMSTPQVTTRSGQKASIEVGHEVVLEPGDPKKTEFVGIRMTVLPKVGDKEIDLEVEASVSEQTGVNGALPIIQAHQAVSQCTINPGSTVILLQDGEIKNGKLREIIFLITPKLTAQEDHPGQNR